MSNKTLHVCSICSPERVGEYDWKFLQVDTDTCVTLASGLYVQCFADKSLDIKINGWSMVGQPCYNYNLYMVKTILAINIIFDEAEYETNDSLNVLF